MIDKLRLKSTGMSRKRLLSKTSRRTLLLALLAAATFVYAAVFHFDIAPQTLLNFFMLSVVMVVIAVLLGGLGAVIIRLLRRD